MRRTTDRGAVIILDSRVVNKRYGSVFVESLPESRRSIKPLDSMIADLENFLSEKA
jgi:ATP-dependent DNA helicase DinG